MAYQYKYNTLQPSGQGMLNRPPTVPLNTPPPYVAPPAASPLGVIASSAASLLLPVAAFFGAFFGFAGPAGEANESIAVQNFNTGAAATKTSQDPYSLPFTGGQGDGAAYRVHYSVFFPDGSYWLSGSASISGKINGLETKTTSPNAGVNIVSKTSGTTYRYNLVTNPLFTAKIDYIETVDGSPDSYGDLPNPNPVKKENIGGYTGTNGETPEERGKKLLPPTPSSTFGDAGVGGFAPVAPFSNKAPSDLLPPKDPKSPPLSPPVGSPIQDPPARSPIKEPTPPLEKPTDKPPDQKPSNPDDDIRANILSILAGITVLGAGIAYIKGLNDQINEQTKPSVQKANVCETLNTPSCTQGFEGRIKDPINQNVNEKTGALNTALSAVNTGLSTFITAATSNFEKILGVLDNQFVDRAMGVVNTALNIHNALMLSADLGRTAAGLVDAAIQFTPLRFVASNGSATTASRVFGQNIEAFFINIIGVENYTNLSNGWAVSNRIIRSVTNGVNRTENLLNKNGKINQQTGIQVGNLANAMLVNGLISKNSYPKVAATKAANDPIDSETADELTSTVGSVGSSIKNLTNVTKEVLTVTRNVQKITTEFGKLAQLANADSMVRKNLYTQISTKAKKRSIYTILDVKQIKINANRRPNSNPFR